MIIVKPVQGKEDEVFQALTAYRDNLVNNSMQYPMNIGKIQASVVENVDGYVCFLLLGGNTMAEQEQGDAAVLAKCQADNEKALSAIKAALAK